MAVPASFLEGNRILCDKFLSMHCDIAGNSKDLSHGNQEEKNVH